MDAQNLSRERVFSILNDNDCPSFVIPQKQASLHPLGSPQQRPSLQRYAQYQHQRSSSFSSTSSSPPLLRHDSASSKSSNSSMDSSPSPITPAYVFGDPNALGYENVMRQDLVGYLPSPTTITPFMESQMMIAPSMHDPFAQKAIIPQQVLSQYPILPAPTHADIAQLPTPAPSNDSTATSVAKTSPVNPSAPPVTGKKNKYPCPYAQSHNCTSTFTTSGHAARHGKKHTGEKGVHCPVCNKAFTRKDNMKQHERTHKNNSNGEDSNPRRSKAAVTRDAQRKQLQQEESEGTASTDLTTSASSDQTSIEPPISELPMLMPDVAFFPDSNPMLLPQQPLPEFIPNSVYPPLTDESLMAVNSIPQTIDLRLAPIGLGNTLLAPSLTRGLSDLDTLAQVAETFDPLYAQPLPLPM